MGVDMKETKRKMDIALNLVKTGLSISKACDKVGVSRRNFYYHVDPETLVKARRASADACFDEMARLEEECLESKLDPAIFRAVTANMQWRLGRINPVKYANNAKVDHVSSDNSMSPKPVLDISSLSYGEVLELVDKVFV